MEGKPMAEQQQQQLLPLSGFPAVSSGGGERATAGFYLARLKTVEETTYPPNPAFNQTEPRECWVWKWEIVSDVQGRVDQAGIEMWSITSRSLGRRSKAYGVLSALYGGADLSDGFQPTLADIQNRQVIVNVINATDAKGQPTTRIDGVQAAAFQANLQPPAPAQYAIPANTYQSNGPQPIQANSFPPAPAMPQQTQQPNGPILQLVPSQPAAPRPQLGTPDAQKFTF